MIADFTVDTPKHLELMYGIILSCSENFIAFFNVLVLPLGQVLNDRLKIYNRKGYFKLTWVKLT